MTAVSRVGTSTPSTPSTPTVIVPALKSDGRSLSTSTTSGSAVLSGAFASSDVGKVVLVPGAGGDSNATPGFGPAKRDLQSTIVSVNPGVSATMADAALTTASQTTLYGTDDAPALQAAINKCIANRGGQVLIVPPDCPPEWYGLGGNTQTLIASQVTIGHGGQTRYRWMGGKISGSTAGGTSAPTLVYLPAVGNLFAVYNATNLILEDLTFQFANSHFRDDLVRFNGNYWFFEDGGWHSGQDNMSCQVNRCSFTSTVAWPHTPFTKTVSITAGQNTLFGSFIESTPVGSNNEFDPASTEVRSWEQHVVTVPGAGPGGADLVTTIVSNGYPTDHVTLKANASTTVTNVQAIIEGGSYLRLNKSIFCYVDGCTVGPSYSGSGIYLGPDYTNIITIERSNFSHARQHVALGSGDAEGVTIRENGFEPCWNGMPGAIRGMEGNNNYQLAIRDNWFGDFSNGGACHIENVAAGMADVAGNFMPSAMHAAGVGYTTLRDGSASVDELQSFSVYGNAGTYTMTFNGQTTTPLAWNANAATIQAALQALSTIGAGNVIVTDGVSYFRHHDFTVQFTGTLARTNVAQITTTTGADMSGIGGHFNLVGVFDIRANNINGEVLFDQSKSPFTADSVGTLEAHVDDNSLTITQFSSNTSGGRGLVFKGGNNRGNAGVKPTNVPQTGDWTRELTQFSSSRTLTLADAGRQLLTADGVTVTIPNASTVPFAEGTEIWIQGGGTNVTLTPATNVALRTPTGYNAKPRASNSIVRMVKLTSTGSNDFWLLDGDLQSAQSLTYSRTGETTQVAQIRAALAALGIVTDSTTA